MQGQKFPLTRAIALFSCPPDDPASPYVAVFYQTTAKISNDSKILCHGNAKKRVSLEKPYVRTNHQILSKAREFIDKGMPPKQVYDQINQESGGVFESPSQGQELRDTQQVYRQKTKTKSAENEDDEFELLLRLQRQEINFVKTLASLSKSYYVFLANDVQLHDVDWFCCKQNGVLSLDTTFNLCKNWITDSCYHNQRLQNRDGQHPVFLGPSLIHFQKDAFIFSRFASEMCSFQPNIRNLNAIGTDQDIAIYRGFATQIPDLKLLLCAYHLQKNDAQKIRELVRQKGALKNIICDIYGRNYGGVKELGLVDSTDIDDFRIKLESLKSVWDNLCPGFHKWFSKNRASFFEQSVIESARTGTKVQGVYYNNSIESQHFWEKMEQSYKKGTVEEVISTLKKMVERQEDDEVRAI